MAGVLLRRIVFHGSGRRVLDGRRSLFPDSKRLRRGMKVRSRSFARRFADAATAVETLLNIGFKILEQE